MAHTNKIRIKSVTFSSIVEIGDTHSFSPVTRAIAVQQEGGVEDDEPFQFEDYELFKREPAKLPAMTEVEQVTTHHHPHIYVDNVNITGVSSSSNVQIGSINTINAEARIKHFRILQDEE